MKRIFSQRFDGERARVASPADSESSVLQKQVMLQRFFFFLRHYFKTTIVFKLELQSLSVPPLCSPRSKYRRRKCVASISGLLNKLSRSSWNVFGFSGLSPRNEMSKAACVHIQTTCSDWICIRSHTVNCSRTGNDPWRPVFQTIPSPSGSMLSIRSLRAA